MIETIHWDKKSREKTHPRSLTNPFKLKSTTVLAKEIQKKATHLDMWEAGLGLTTPTLRKNTQVTLQKLSDVKLMKDWSLSQAACLGILLEINENPYERTKSRTPSLYTEYLLSSEGAVFTLKVMMEVRELVERSDGFGRQCWLVRKTPQTTNSWESFMDLPLDAWSPLRKYLLTCSSKEYQEASQWAQETRSKTDNLKVKCSLSFCFPKEPEWAEKDFEECLEKTEKNFYGAEQILAQGWWLLYSIENISILKNHLNGLAKNFSGHYAWAILDLMGEEAIAVLEEVLSVYTEMVQERHWPLSTINENRRYILEALSIIENEKVGNILASYLATKGMAKYVSPYFEKYPKIALKVLPQYKKGNVGKEADSIVKGIVRSQPDLVTELLSQVEGKTQEELDKLVQKNSSHIKEAESKDIPNILQNPPWESKKSTSVIVLNDLPTLPFKTKINWRERKKPRICMYDRPPQLSTPEKDRSGLLDLQNRAKKKKIHMWDLDRYTDGAALEFWSTASPKVWYFGDSLLFILSRFDIDAIPGFLNLQGKRSDQVLEALDYVISPEVAPFMASCLQKGRKSQEIARKWFQRNPKEASQGLIPNALGKVGLERTNAEAALRFLESEGYESEICQVAEKYGKEALGALKKVLQVDPLLIFPQKIPSLPAFWKPEAWPLILLQNEKGCLPMEAVENLGKMLCFSTLEEPYAGLEIIKATCTSSSLEDFTWELFSQWLREGAPNKEQWAFTSLGYLGGDKTARKLSGLIRKWPGESAHARATLGIDILAQIGTDLALMHLHGISQKVKYKSIQSKARQKMNDLAKALNLTTEELADRLVPDLGFNQEGVRTLDFGPRSFQVFLDEKYKPALRENDGKSIKSLPKENSQDNLEKVKQAKKDLSLLKKDLKHFIETQKTRLEMAMCTKRAWSVNTFQNLFLTNPLLRQLFIGLVFIIQDKDEKFLSSFTVKAEGTCTDHKNNKTLLPLDGKIQIIHPMNLEEGLKKAWLDFFQKNKTTPIFPQLKRSFYQATPEEIKAKSILRFQGKSVPQSRILKLENRNWKKGEVWDSGWTEEMFKPLPGNKAVAFLRISPGLCLADPTESSPQELKKVNFFKTERQSGNRLSLDKIAPLLLSEIMYDLEEV